MKVSVITPVYNDPRVGRTIDVVQRQALDHQIEHIVVDGDSDRETKAILEQRRDDIDVLVSEPDRGIYDAMNKGIREATGEVVGILNADDRWQDQEVLSRVVSAFESTGADAVYGDKALVNTEDKVVRYWRPGEHAPWKWYFGWMPPHPTLFLRRRVYEENDRFDLAFPYAADYELMLRLFLQEEVESTYIPRVLTRFELGGNSNETLGDVVEANREVRRAWKKNDLRFGQLVPVLKPSRKLFQYLRAVPVRNLAAGEQASTPSTGASKR